MDSEDKPTNKPMRLTNKRFLAKMGTHPIDVITVRGEIKEGNVIEVRQPRWVKWRIDRIDEGGRLRLSMA